jgi:hypothetical protein
MGWERDMGKKRREDKRVTRKVYSRKEIKEVRNQDTNEIMPFSLAGLC